MRPAVRVGAKTTAEILCRVAGSSCDAGTNEDIPKFAPPNDVYPSWAAYIRRKGTNEFVAKYKGRSSF